MGKVTIPSEERIRLLSLVEVFEPLSREELEWLNGRLSHIYLDPGENFYAPEEDHSEKLFVLCKGQIRVYKVAAARELTLAVLEAGTVFGERALTTQRLQKAYAQAIKPSEIFILRRECLEHLIVEKPEVGLRMMCQLSERLRHYEIRLECLFLKSITARLASMILLLLESEGVVTSQSYLKIPTHYTHQHLGTMIRANREAVTKAFARLQDAGVVELRRRLIYVADVEALRRIAEDEGGFPRSLRSPTEQPCSSNSRFSR